PRKATPSPPPRREVEQHPRRLRLLEGRDATSPTARPGDTTPWYASLWAFCRRSCDERFGDAWLALEDHANVWSAAMTGATRAQLIRSAAGCGRSPTTPA